ncbi:hypothetical protein DFJ74DRAFT_666560 [Hyaloraphidium curvatum]|nr:hypothetical protein DFJ74DRAFT_666560 [Hyaloraphidium curvatum]
MTASRRCFDLGAPELYRHFELNSFADPGKMVADPRMAAFSKHIRRLALTYLGHPEDATSAFLAGVMPHVRHLEFFSSSYASTALVWNALAAASRSSDSLKRIDMDLMSDAAQFFTSGLHSVPPSVEHVSLYLDGFARAPPTLRVLEQAPGLRSWALLSEYHEDLRKYPALAGKLRHAATGNQFNALSKIVSLPGLRLESLEVRSERIRDVDLGLALRHEHLERLILRDCPTADLLGLGDAPPRLRELEMANPTLCVPADRLGELAGQLTGYGLRRIRVVLPKWRAREAKAEEEGKVWRSLPGVVWMEV